MKIKNLTDIVLSFRPDVIRRSIMNKKYPLLNKLFVFFFLLALLGAAAGCASTKTHTPHITFFIQADDSANNEQPFYILFRSVSERNFLTESYQQVAGLVFANTSDENILGRQVIMPGNKREIIVEEPLKDPVGVYCLFTKPSDQWKILLKKPLASKYDIRLEKNRILQKKRGFWNIFRRDKE